MTKYGLKDNDIAVIVNAIRDDLAEFVPQECLRGRISAVLIDKLEELGLRIDKPAARGD